MRRNLLQPLMSYPLSDNVDDDSRLTLPRVFVLFSAAFCATWRVCWRTTPRSTRRCAAGTPSQRGWASATSRACAPPCRMPTHPAWPDPTLPWSRTPTVRPRPCPTLFVFTVHTRRAVCLVTRVDSPGLGSRGGLAERVAYTACPEDNTALHIERAGSATDTSEPPSTRRP